MSLAHINYDEQVLSKRYNEYLKIFTYEEIDAFNKFMECTVRYRLHGLFGSSEALDNVIPDRHDIKKFI